MAADVFEALPDPGGLDASLASGDAGLAVAAGYAASTLDVAFQDPARRFLARATQAGADSLSFFGGLSGIGWAAEHLAPTLGSGNVGEALDRTLIERLDRPWERDVDLVSGLTGLGVYALERLPRPEAGKALELILGHLHGRAKPDGAGVTWWSEASWLPETHRHLYPDRSINLGLAHGTPGIVALLAAAGPAGDLLTRAVTGLLLHRGEGGPSCFPRWAAPGEEPVPARTAWCYGDPGVASALLQAGMAAGRADWTEAGVQVARAAAARDPAEGRVVDAGLCHGATGLSLAFARMARVTGDDALRAAAASWAERAMDMREVSEGIGGFRSAVPDGDGVAWRNDPSLLTGAAGVALGLLAAATDVEPRWDRFLMLSTRRAPDPVAAGA